MLLLLCTLLPLLTQRAGGDGGCDGGYSLHPSFVHRIEVDLQPYKAKGGITWEDVSILSYVGGVGLVWVACGL